MQDFTRASALIGYGELASQMGLNPQAMIRASGLPESILEHADGLISYRLFLRLLDLSSVTAADSFFGLKLGLFQGISVFGPLLYLIRNASSVGAALEELRAYFYLHMAAAEVHIEQFDDRVELSYQVKGTSLPGLTQGAELAVGVGVKLMQALCGSRWNLLAVMFEHQPQGPLTQYTRLLGVKPLFNAQVNGILFPSELLSQPLEAADPALHQLMRQHLDTLQGLSERELPDYVSSILRNHLDQGRVTVDTVAKYMATSRRTLQRRLAECGTSFQTVLDQTRQNMAQHYLRDSSLQMTQLADLLGYSDLSAFSRAFTRWFGVPPSQWSQDLFLMGHH